MRRGRKQNNEKLLKDSVSKENRPGKYFLFKGDRVNGECGLN